MSSVGKGVEKGTFSYIGGDGVNWQFSGVYTYQKSSKCTFETSASATSNLMVKWLNIFPLRSISWRPEHNKKIGLHRQEGILQQTSFRRHQQRWLSWVASPPAHTADFRLASLCKCVRQFLTINLSPRIYSHVPPNDVSVNNSPHIRLMMVPQDEYHTA